MEETVAIGKDVALILFDLLWGFRDQATLPIQDNAQRAALWSIQATLESCLVEPFLPEQEFGQILNEAKQRLTSKYGLSSR